MSGFKSVVEGPRGHDAANHCPPLLKVARMHTEVLDARNRIRTPSAIPFYVAATCAVSAPISLNVAIGFLIPQGWTSELLHPS